MVYEHLDKHYFILGSEDLEMYTIRNYLNRLDLRYFAALNENFKRCSGGYSNSIFPIHKHPDLADMIPIFVECCPKGGYPENAVIIDHHTPGSFGYDLGPDKFVEASSLGQVLAIVNYDDGPQFDGTNWIYKGEKLNQDWVLTMAYDHCLPRALNNECPGVTASAVFDFRNFKRAQYRRVDKKVILNELNMHVEVIGKSRYIPHEGKKIFLVNHLCLPDLYETTILGHLNTLRIFDTKEGKITYSLITGDLELLQDFAEGNIFGKFEELTVDWNRCVGKGIRTK
jgi:hypothetical protein